MNPIKEHFGTLPSGEEIYRYTMTNAQGLKVQVMTYGATLTAVETPDRQGQLTNITLNLDTLADYAAGHPCLGCVCGRYANRIAQGRFTLDGKEYSLSVNIPPNHLHGGHKGFHKHVWQDEPVIGEGFSGVKLTLVSPDGDEGYPGRLTATVAYTLTDTNELKMAYTAETDKPTVVNLTNHAYWNLAGRTSGLMYDQVLMIQADEYLPTSDQLMPLGPAAPVAGTPMDFNTPQPIGSRMAELPGGYDHNYILRKAQPGELSLAARAYDPGSGRTMEVFTTQPGVQLYSANFLNGLKAGGIEYRNHFGFCLETQHYPDSPNHPEYPSTVLRRAKRTRS